MTKPRTYIVLLLAFACGYSCESLGGGNASENKANTVARVGNTFLYKRDLLGLVPPNTPAQDSTDLVKKFVDNWIKEELLIQEASNSINIDLSEIERKVASYRFALISYEYQKQRIEQQLNRSVTAEEIDNYYAENLDNFILRQNIVRGRYIKLPREAPRISDARRWIKSPRPLDLESLNTYCAQFANNFSLEDSTWIKFDDVIKNSPFSTISNKIQFLRRNRYVEETDSAYLYLFKIDAFKISDEVSPLEFVREDIENIIINKRKVALAKSLENDIYERAKENEDFEIFK